MYVEIYFFDICNNFFYYYGKLICFYVNLYVILLKIEFLFNNYFNFIIVKL